MSELVSQNLTDQKPNIKELVAKEDNLSTEEAMMVLNHYDAKLKDLGKMRMQKPNVASAEYGMESSGSIRIMISGVAASFATAIGASAAVAGPDLFALAVLPAVVPVFWVSMADRFEAFRMSVSSSRKKEAYKDTVAGNRLYELKEKEYEKIAKKMLKKARPALDVVNSNLSTKEFVYSSTLSDEGFELTERSLTKWQKATLEIEQTDDVEAMKALEMGKISLKKEIEA